MSRNRLIQGYALAAVTALVASLLVGSGTAASADASVPPTEVAVVPPGQPLDPPQDLIIFAGATGFLHRHDASPDYLWTRYDSGQSTVVSDLARLDPAVIRSAGGDSVGIDAQVPSRPASGDVSVLNLADQTWQQWPVPAGYTAIGEYGSSMLVTGPQNNVPVLDVLTFDAAGTATWTPVTGLPSDATFSAPQPRVGDAVSAVVDYVSAGTVHNALVDVATGAAVEIPGADSASDLFVLSGDNVAWHLQGTLPVHVYSRSGLRDGTNTASRDAALPSTQPYRFAVVGTHVLASVTNNSANNLAPALDLPLGGGASPTVLAKVAYQNPTLVQGPGDAAIVVGGSGVSDWAVHRFSLGSAGALGDAQVLAEFDPVSNAGLTISQGLLRHVESQIAPTTGAKQYAMYNHAVSPDDGSGGRIPERDWGGVLSANAQSCAPDAHCLHMVDGNGYGVAYAATMTGTATEIDTQIDGYTSHASQDVPSGNSVVVDASPGYVLVNGGSPATQYVVDLGYQKIARSGPIVGAALWFHTLWTATSTAGQLIAVDVATGGTTRTVATGAPCAPTELQATLRWLYWSCGASGPAGVYDLQQNAAITLPAGPVLLGDGYVVWHDSIAADVKMVDFHAGSAAAPVSLGGLAASGVPADRNVTWAVDKYSGDVAYVSVDDSVHVIDPSVPRSAPAFGDVWAGTDAYPRGTGSGASWVVNAQLSRPIASWTLTVTQATTGQMVATRSGGPARKRVLSSWDGHLTSGAPAVSGRYLWKISGVGAGSTSPAVLGSGDFYVQCGQPQFRSYSCHGRPALLGVKGTWNGESHWYQGTSSGGLTDNDYTENWYLGTGAWQASAIVPFGDFNGDGNNDLIVRYGSGVLYAYLGIGQPYFNTQSVKSIRMGSGWNAYNAIVAPGDLNGDGHDDLLGRDAYGQLWLYTSTGTGAFRNRVFAGWGWNMYARLIGAGDLNGDAIGDLLAVDSSGVMWRYYGNGRGGFTSRIRVFAGWNIYNAIVPIGDLNQDGHNDLVARDAYGGLWFYAGHGDGTFSPRVREGWGWQMYKAIF